MRMFTQVYPQKLSGLSSRALKVFFLLCFFGALMACDGAKTAVTEEFAILPYSQDQLVSEFAQQGRREGRIALIHSLTGQRSTLYSSNSSNDLKLRPAIWGDFNCDEPDQFSPQGFDLTQRPSGRWQLLVVNHSLSETVEMFELQKNADGDWQLIWRGCVVMPTQHSFNDVKALSDSFVLKRTPSVQAALARWLKNILRRDTAMQWRWRLRDGFQLIAISDNE